MTEEEKGNMAKTLSYVLNRLKEPSSWAGIALFIGFFGVSPNTISRVVENGPSLIAAVGALVAIFAPSSGRKALVEVREAKAVAQDAVETAQDAVEQAAADCPPETVQVSGVRPVV